MKEQIKVPEELSNKRADTIVTSMLPNFSRSFWQKQFEKNRISTNGQMLKPSSKLSEGDLVTIDIPKNISEAIDFPIIYEDKDIIVINKPRGILTHAKGVIAEEFTVADFMRSRTTDGLETNRPGIVHRLDRDTSGLLVCAKHTEAKTWLQKQFSERKVKKTYVALLKGILQPNHAILKLPIERNPKSPQTFRVSATGKPSETEYEVIEYFNNNTLVRLKPLTGRTHQLRVHMLYLNTPIVGDKLYENPKTKSNLFLHAEELELTIPSNHERKIFQSPLPSELQQELKKYRK